MCGIIQSIQSSLSVSEMRLKMGSRRQLEEEDEEDEQDGGGGLAEAKLSESKSDDKESTGEGDPCNSANLSCMTAISPSKILPR